MMRSLVSDRPWHWAVLFALLIIVSLVPVRAMAGEAALQVRSMLVEQRWVVRVPVQPRNLRIEWREKNKVKCIGVPDLAAASLVDDNAIDFLLHSGERVRAKLDRRCPALDFYDGFYLQPRDPLLCVKRDVVLPRMGGSCPITTLVYLKPRLKKR